MLFIVFFVSIAVLGAGIYFFNVHYFLPLKIRRIDRLLDEKKYEDAMRLLKNLSPKEKVDPLIQYKVYELYMGQNQYLMALFYLKEIVKRNVFSQKFPEPLVRMKIADIYEITGKPKRALEEYRYILEKIPDHYEANRKTGEQLFQMKNFDAAMPFLEKAYTLDKDNGSVNRYLAEIYLINKSYPKVIDLTTRNIEQGKQDDEINYFLRGQAYLKEEKYQKCQEDMEVAKKNPSFERESRLISAIASYRLGDIERASESFKYTLHTFTNDYSELVLEAKYVHSEVLIRDGKIRECLGELLFIDNSGKNYRDVQRRIHVLSPIQSNTTYMTLYKNGIEAYIRKNLTEWKNFRSHSLRKTLVISRHATFFITEKRVSRQGFRVGVGLDFNLSLTQEKEASAFLSFLKADGLSSGYFFSLMGLETGAHTAFKLSNCEINIIDDIEGWGKITDGEIAL